MELYLIRHGDMAGDPHRHCAPPVDGCLSDLGCRQAAALGQALAGVEFTAIYASPLGRAIQTAQALAGSRQMCGLSDPKLWKSESALLNYADAGTGPLTLRRLVDAFRGGRVFASSGPMIALSVDGHPMGDVAQTSRDQVHHVVLDARPGPGQPALGRVELLGRGGRVLWRRDEWRGGRVEFTIKGLGERGYLVARAFGTESNGGGAWREVRQIAMSNPVYLHPRGQAFNRPATTRVNITIQPDSPFVGGEVRFESMDGQLLSTKTPARGCFAETLPASGRVKLVGPDGRCRTDYLVNANPALQAAQRYLYRGRFLLDFPNLQPGELPPEAWRIDRYVDAMREVTLTY